MYSELTLWQREYDVPGQIVLRHELDLGLKRNARILFMEDVPESEAQTVSEEAKEKIRALTQHVSIDHASGGVPGAPGFGGPYAYAKIHRDSEPCVIIDIDKHIPLGSLCFEALEWHEFCHAEPWLRDHVHTGHDNGFMLRYLRKPLLFLANLFVVPILYPLYRREI